jgi:hypothetical protein
LRMAAQRIVRRRLLTHVRPSTTLLWQSRA